MEKGDDSGVTARAPWLPAALVAWGLVAAIEIALVAALPGTIVRRSLLAPPFRLGLVGLDLSMALGLVFVSAWAGSGILRRIRGRTGRILARGALLLATLGGTLLYFSSWMQFYYTSHFLDLGGLDFWSSHPTQLLQHVEHMTPLLFVATPVAALAMALLLAVIIPAAVPRLQARARGAMTTALALVAAVAVAATVAGALGVNFDRGDAVDPQTGSRYTLLERYLLERWERTGPLPHLLLVPRERYAPALVTAGAPRPAVIRRSQVDLATYLADVDPARARRLSVIVVLIESLRPDQLQAFGGARPVMDAVDALARDARVFTRTYTQASTSSYADLCPLSSHYPLRSRGFHQYPVNPPYPRVLIYDILHGLGYAVGIFSSQNESWGGMKNYLETGNVDKFVQAETYAGPTYVPRLDTGFAQWVKGEKRAGKIDDRYTVGEAIEWIGGLGDRPFFAYLNLQNSHVPYELPGDFPHRYGPAELDFTIAFAQFPRDKVSVVKDLYADSLVYVDHQLARLFDALKAGGRWDDTIVVVSGDTGQAFFEHGFAAHGGPLYDEVMRVPLVIRAPGLARGRYDGLAQHVDVPPTLLSLLGLPPHPAYQGVDLLGDVPEPRTAYLMGQGALATQLAVVRDGKKLILDIKEQRHLLYDLERDPDERLDLAAARPDLVRDLGGRLDTWVLEQLAFYESAERMQSEYPPVLAD